MNISTILTRPIYLTWKKFSLLTVCCLALLSGTGQIKQNDFIEAWKKIDSLINKQGLTQSALAEVNKLYGFAKKDNNEVQVVKALIYRIDLEEKQEDNPIQNDILLLEKELRLASIVPRSILTSIL